MKHNPIFVEISAKLWKKVSRKCGLIISFKKPPKVKKLLVNTPDGSKQELGTINDRIDEFTFDWNILNRRFETFESWSDALGLTFA
jgi:hypothetical protein